MSPSALPLAPVTPAHVAGRDPWAAQVRLARVQYVIAMGAGEGEVGTSIVAVNIAPAVSAEGLQVALLGADIYGPSLPILLGIPDCMARAHVMPGRHIVPVIVHGLRS